LIYNSGTVAVTNGNNAVVGMGTKFLANVAAGQWFSIKDSNVFYTVASVVDDTHLTLSANYGGTTGSGKDYFVFQSFTLNYNLPIIEMGDVNVAAILGLAMVRIDAKLKEIRDLIP
jgi:hypothetical protein